MRNNCIRIAAVSALMALAATVAFAGGPQFTFDAANRVPYLWHLNNHPNGAVPYYTDLGPLGRLSNAQSDGLVDSAFGEWNNVPSSSLLTANAGDFASIGLPDIVCVNTANCNPNLVIGAWNGGGIHVIYDTDGRILQNYLGIFGALGVTSIDFVDEDSNEILEAWVVLNGPSVQSSDPNGDRFRGVMTHEFGHAVNLAHSQANGFVFQFADTPGATGCPVPYTGSPNNTQIETMYPCINLGTTATGTGLGMATVDRIDDIAAISDLYPAAGWPASHGTIRGTISSLLNIRGNGTGDAREVTGVNVIARNVADPFNDFTSYISGQVSKGAAGADGSFVLNGLTPGAQYVLYVDNPRNGAFNVPRLISLPGPEEYYNAALESGNGETDNRCSHTTVTAQAGTVATADITFNRVKGAPDFIPQPGIGTPTDLTPDGLTAVGVFGGTGSGAYIWDLTSNTMTNIGGAADGGNASISDDGTKIAFSDRVGGLFTPAVYENGVWTPLPLRPEVTGPCGSSYGSSWGISGDGQTVVGLSWNTCATALTRGFISKGGVTQALPKHESSPTRANRANAVNDDGTLIAGWDDAQTGLRRGAFWTVAPDGIISPATLIHPDPNAFAGEALAICRDGSSIIGLNHRPDSTTLNMDAWHYDFPGGLEEYPNIPGASRGAANCISDDNRIVGGWSDVPTNPPFPGTTRIPTIFTTELGWSNLNTFMNAQGTFAQDIAIANPMAMSADGKIIIGWANSTFGQVGWAMKIPKAVVCHGQPDDFRATARTIDVSFPDGLGEHLAHGDTLGLCPEGQ